ncbi:ATP-binding protein [Bacteriovorax sp. Seq25_V]|uniref:ATP-binding protein n=1 Tax=Bacteriovorax sp. Seq25_V TaxID=1201288 RepID=UPI00038A1957|nr:ATP-binding protein [Bacteriovorax sp. Seq25_V]EQC43965.1 AAA domain protein [Bacteriovorax sp. Seq25_V]
MLKIVFLLFLGLNAFGKCEKKETLKNYNESLSVLNEREADLKSILAGNTTNISSSLSNVFGESVDESSMDTLLKKLEDQRITKSIVPVELSGLYSCLLELNLDKEERILYHSFERILDLKFLLLTKNKELGNAIKEGIITQESLPELKHQLIEENLESLKLKKEIETTVAKAEKNVLAEKSRDVKELLGLKGNLAKLKIEIINKSIEYNNNLEGNIKRFEQTSKQLSVISSSFSTMTLESKEKAFEEVDVIWSDIIRNNFLKIISAENDFDIPSVVALPAKVLENRNSDVVSEIITLHEQLKEYRLKITKDVSEKKSNELKIQNSLLIQVNAIRSKIYSELSAGYVLSKFVTPAFWSSLRKEFVASPYRVVSFFFEKYLYVREKVNLGSPGIKILVTDIMTIAFLIGVLFFINFCFLQVFKFLNDIVTKLARANRSSALVNVLVSYWFKLKDNLTTISWLLIICLIKPMENFVDVLFIVEIIEIILVSKLIKAVVEIFLGNISRIDSRNFIQFKEKSHKTTQGIVKIFLFYFISMILVEGTLGRVYVYSLINIIALVSALYLLVVESTVWEEDFLSYLEKNFSGMIVDYVEKFSAIIPKKIRAVYFLFFLILLGVFNLFIKLTENFEVSKKISANLFKKQIENIEIEEDLAEIPNSYRDLFSLNSSDSTADYVMSTSGIEDQIIKQVQEWVEDHRDEHSAILFGDKGVGKTTLIHYIENTLKADAGEIETIYLKVPSKTTSVEGIKEFLRPHCDTKGDENNIGEEIDQQKTKKVIFLDEAQNVFLSCSGGFDSYYYLVDLVNSSNDIFWILSFNKYSWIYLDRAFGRNQFFRNIYELKGWSDSKIKELIMKRHQSSKFRLSYDSLISATRSEDEVDKYASIESKFFKLLWEVSSGNPRASLHLWLSSLSLKKGRLLNVNIPKIIETKGIEKSSDELLFVLSHILKHENLNIPELQNTTNIPIGLVRNAVKVCLERNYLFRDKNGRFMIDITTQYNLIKYLRSRNFIYGN